jgi:hypothetical protein
MYAHVEDQMATVSEDIQMIKKKIFTIQRKKQEAIGNGKLALAQKFIVEVHLIFSSSSRPEMVWLLGRYP